MDIHTGRKYIEGLWDYGTTMTHADSLNQQSEKPFFIVLALIPLMQVHGCTVLEENCLPSCYLLLFYFFIECSDDYYILLRIFFCYYFNNIHSSTSAVV